MSWLGVKCTSWDLPPLPLPLKTPWVAGPENYTYTLELVQCSFEKNTPTLTLYVFLNYECPAASPEGTAKVRGEVLQTGWADSCQCLQVVLQILLAGA